MTRTSSDLAGQDSSKRREWAIQRLRGRNMIWQSHEHDRYMWAKSAKARRERPSKRHLWVTSMQMEERALFGRFVLHGVIDDVSQIHPSRSMMCHNPYFFHFYKICFKIIVIWKFLANFCYSLELRRNSRYPCFLFSFGTIQIAVFNQLSLVQRSFSHPSG